MLEEPSCFHCSCLAEGLAALSWLLVHNKQPQRIAQLFSKQQLHHEYQWQSEGVDLISDGCELPSTQLNPPHRSPAASQRSQGTSAAGLLFPNITCQALTKHPPRVPAVLWEAPENSPLLHPQGLAAWRCKGLRTAPPHLP